MSVVYIIECAPKYNVVIVFNYRGPLIREGRGSCFIHLLSKQPDMECQFKN